MATFGTVTLPERRRSAVIVATILALVAVRLVCAAAIPLSFEESTYWVYSQHIGAGYFDQPPIEPILIRLSTTLFGNNEFGVRAIGVLLALPATWAVWRAGTILFDEAVGARAALYFNLTLVMAAGSIIATPDGPLVAATALLVLALAKLLATGASRVVARDRRRLRARDSFEIHDVSFRRQHFCLAITGSGNAQMAGYAVALVRRVDRARNVFADALVECGAQLVVGALPVRPDGRARMGVALFL